MQKSQVRYAMHIVIEVTLLIVGAILSFSLLDLVIPVIIDHVDDFSLRTFIIPLLAVIYFLTSLGMVLAMRGPNRALFTGASLYVLVDQIIFFASHSVAFKTYIAHPAVHVPSIVVIATLVIGFTVKFVYYRVRQFRLYYLPGKFAVAKHPAQTPINDCLTGEPSLFFSAIRSAEELVIAGEEHIFKPHEHLTRQLRLFRFNHPRGSQEPNNHLARLMRAVKNYKVPVFVFTTTEASFLLIKDKDVKTALASWRSFGIRTIPL